MFKIIKEFLEFKKHKKELEENIKDLSNYNKELEFFISDLSRDFTKLDLFIEKSKNLNKNTLNLESVYMKILFSSLILISEKSEFINEKIEIRKLIRLAIYILLRRYEKNYIEEVEQIILKIKEINIYNKNIIDEVITRNLDKEDLIILASRIESEKKDF